MPSLELLRKKIIVKDGLHTLEEKPILHVTSATRLLINMKTALKIDANIATDLVTNLPTVPTDQEDNWLARIANKPLIYLKTAQKTNVMAVMNMAI
jgi:hypothetical protein